MDDRDREMPTNDSQLWPGNIPHQLPPGLADIFEQISDVVIALDRNWRFVYANRRVAEEMRLPREALLGRTLWAELPSLLGTEAEAQCRKALAEQATVHFVSQNIFSGRWYEVTVYPRAEGLTIHGRDITERRQTEDKLRESEERHRAISELTSDYAYSARVDPDGYVEVETVTAGFERVTGYTFEENRKLGGWAAFIHPEDLPGTYQRLPRLLSGERDVQAIRIITKAGEIRSIRYLTQPIWDSAAGRVTRLLGAVQDITEHERVEAARREIEARFKDFMDNSPAVAFIKDEEGRYAYINKVFEERFRRKLQDVVGLTDFDLWPKHFAQAFRDADLAVLAAGVTLEFGEMTPDPDGSSQYWQTFKFPFRDASGARYVGGIAVDISKQRRAEEELKKYADQLQALSRRLLEVQEQERRYLARELHDEVGQVLTGLKLSLGTVSQSLPHDVRTRLTEAQSLLKDLAGRVRDLSLRLRPTMLDDLGLVPALLWHIDRYAAQTGVRVAFEQSGLDRRFEPEVETAAYRIVQEALTNVARHAGVRQAAVRLWCEQRNLNVQVEDEGVGFPSERVRAEGKSSGLSGMRERAVLLGGWLEIASRPGGGTRVTAELPAGSPGSSARLPQNDREP